MTPSAENRRRNGALDYLRAGALILMSLVHMWRFVLGRGRGDEVLLFLGETAPCLFFVAFGMTQTRFVTKGRREILSFLGLFGVISMFHSLFLLYGLTWEFFLFLWGSSVLMVAGSRAGLRAGHFLALSAVILAINFFVPLGVSEYVVIWRPVSAETRASMDLAARLWLLPPGPFYPLPWAVLPFFGFALGMNELRHSGRAAALAALCIAVLLAVGGLAIREPGLPLASHLELDKLTATSTYMIAGCAWTALVYAVLHWVHRQEELNRLLYPPARFLSEHLMEGTILHYAIIRLLRAVAPRLGGAPAPDWTMVIVWSAANVVLLFASLKLLMMVWSTVAPRARWLLERATVPRVALLSLGLYVGLRVSLAAAIAPPRLATWLAYAAMPALALFYRYDRDRGKGDSLLFRRSPSGGTTKEKEK